MTLEEFTQAFMEANNMPAGKAEVATMLARITDQARKKAAGNASVALSEEEVEQIILGQNLEPQRAQDAPKVEKEQEPAPKPKAAPETKKQPQKKETDQLDIFSIGVDLWADQ